MPPMASPLRTCLASAVLLVLGTVRGAAQDLGSALSNFESEMDGYSVVTSGNVTLNSYSDTYGSLAVGGNLTVTSTGAIATSASGSNPSLYVAGNVSLSDSSTTMLNSGYASTPGLSSSTWSWNSSSQTLSASNETGTLSTNNAGHSGYAASDPLTNPGASGFNFGSASSALASDSNTLASATATGTVSVSSGNLEFTPNTTPSAGSVVVFNVTTEQLDTSGASNISINVPTDVNYVINVTVSSGYSTIFGSGMNFNSGSNDNQLLWNIIGSGNVTLGGDTFYGEILAPGMNVSNTNNTIIQNGVDAASLTDNGAQIHNDGFAAVATVPEPAVFGWCAAALCGLALVFRRRLLGASLSTRG